MRLGPTSQSMNLEPLGEAVRAVEGHLHEAGVEVVETVLGP